LDELEYRIDGTNKKTQKHRNTEAQKNRTSATPKLNDTRNRIRFILTYTSKSRTAMPYEFDKDCIADGDWLKEPA
jgi:hypothetical protein